MTPTTPLESPWRDMASAPKDQELLVKGGECGFFGATFPEWYPHGGVALVQWDEMENAWRGGEMDGEFFYYKPTHYITVADLLASAPPPSPNELLEAAKAMVRDDDDCLYESEYDGRTYTLCVYCDYQDDIRPRHNASCPVVALRTAIRNAEQTGARARSLIPESNNGEAGE